MTHVAKHVRSPHLAFGDRLEAGHVLADFVNPEPDRGAVILALPRGGVPVAYPLSRAARAPLTAVIARKLPIPSSPEMGFGAVAIDGTMVLNQPVVAAFRIREDVASGIADRVRDEVRRRAIQYVGDDLPPEVRGKHVYMVDDGLATGYTMMAAATMVRAGEPSSITLCVPVSPADSLSTVEPYFDEIYCLIVQDRPPFAVASFYRDFHDLSDEEVTRILRGNQAESEGEGRVSRQ